jgi:cell division septation protein DedD
VRFPLFALALVFAACSASEDRGATAASAASLGPDAIVLRVPAQGGAARAYRYPALDTLIWSTKAALPAQVHPLAFNIDAGTLALTDAGGIAWRLTLGSGVLERALSTPLGEPVSLDGSGIYGTSGGAVIRLNTSDATPWQVRSTASLSQLQPLRDGGVLLIGHRDKETVLARFRPPGTAAVDSAILDGTASLISAAGGDRYYLSDGPSRLVSVRARDLEKLGTISLGDSILATASSPSGDRVYVLGRDGDEARLQIINKYSDEVVAKLDVPADATSLRMDPLGRYLLVRHGGASDSVLVVGIASDNVLGRFVSPWRRDLPLVFPDGRLATLRGNDVVVLAADDFRPLSVVKGGAKDIWTVVQWNGFRRRAGDAPLRASGTLADTTSRLAGDSARRRAAADSIRRDSSRGVTVDTSRKPVARVDSQPRPPVTVQAAPAAIPDAEGPTSMGERGSFVVQFAALKAERPAQQLAASIKANGEKAHVVTTSTNGIALYRVILGPFRSRSDAERAGQAAGRDYWVFEGGSN